MKRPAAFTHSVLAALSGVAWRYRRTTIAAVAFFCLATFAAIAAPFGVKVLVEYLSARASLAFPTAAIVGFAFLLLTSSALKEGCGYLVARAARQVVSDSAQRAVGHLHRLGPSVDELGRRVVLINDIDRGSTGLGLLFTATLSVFFPSLLELTGVLALTLVLFPWSVAALIGATFASVLASGVMFDNRRVANRSTSPSIDTRSNRRLVDRLDRARSVGSTVGIAADPKRIAITIEADARSDDDERRARGLLRLGHGAILAIGTAGVMVLAAQYVIADRMTLGDLVLVLVYMLQVGVASSALSLLVNESREAARATDRMLLLFDLVPELDESPDASPLALDRGRVRFEHIDVALDPGRQVLRGVAFTIEPGTTVAVVGAADCGKSMLGRLLLRSLDPTRGRITIDDQDLRAVTRASLGESVGIVSQHPVLFDDTIAANIAHGRPDATRNEIIEAATAARVHDFIMSLPQQYNTVVGAEGLAISRGEMQRIAIARAMLKNPAILILDEATTALDTRAERAIQAALQRFCADRTTLVIAHRLSTVVSADEIIVLERGQIIERGKHDRLLAQRGVYAQMWELQRRQDTLEETGRRMTRQPVNLATMVVSIVDALRTRIDARALNLYSTLVDEACGVTGDAAALQEGDLAFS